ncbi:type III secretion protein [Stutzerimonas nosocomialis]|uniref:type III secretion protein n=1 Tax=Stutzerimonas nosocomialis TaxID=1056496 RepID=UPI0011088B37|nr:type III secretion protein [Stutzerimonas nosocomialis]TLX58656.1 type III secretion protein [Stutzerimonas nosocomialis]
MSAAALSQAPLRERLADPGAWLPAERLADCFGGALSPEQARELAGQPRFRPRMAQLLAEHFALASLEQALDGAPEDLQALFLSPAARARLPRLCGAVLHGATLAREIRRERVTRLQQHLGSELFTFAVTHRALGRAASVLLDVESLVAAIDRDGDACVAAWLQTLEPAVQGWARLVLRAPAGRGPDEAKAAGIVRLAVRMLAAEDAREAP